MSGFTKLYPSLLDSSVWHEPEQVRLVWVTLLCLADQDGIVRQSVLGVASRARVPLAAAAEALAKFEAPDEHSRTKEHEGRRIEAIDGGWKLLNHGKFRAQRDSEERRTRNAERVRKYRERNAVKRSVTPVTLCNPIAEAEAEAEAEATQPPVVSTRAASKQGREPSLTDPVAAVVAEIERIGPPSWSRPYREQVTKVVRALLGDGLLVPQIIAAWGRYVADDYWRPKGCPPPRFREDFPKYAAEPPAPKASADEKRRAVGRPSSDWRLCECGHPAARYHDGGRCKATSCGCEAFRESAEEVTA